jgi:acyl-CoA synthetase (AMP-forming)/AMP-acid ligase II
VTASPANGAAVTFTSLPTTGTTGAIVSPQNLLFHRNAYTLACADLELPEGVHFAGSAADKDVGLSIRIVRQYTINNDAIPTRLDVLYGWAPLYQELGCRVAA